jgi:hypothetical protein
MSLLSRDTLPKELAAGMLCGFLRGNGHSWVECFTAMEDYFANNQIATVAQKSLRPELPRKDYRLEGITCSVGCSEYLNDWLTHNRKHFHSVIVATDKNDLDSQSVAKSFGVNLLVTDAFYLNGNKFDRGTVYDMALRHLKYKDFVALIDCDIVLRPDFSSFLGKEGLRQDIFYGCDRLNIEDKAEKEKFRNGRPFRSVLASQEEWGFGYFQMFNMNNKHIHGKAHLYPSAKDANFSDYLFRAQFGSGHQFKDGVWSWDKTAQSKLDIPCYHLGSDGQKSLTKKHKD